MRLLATIDETEMVSVFLQTEINSARFALSLLALLQRDGKDRRVVDTPDLSSAQENSYRMHLLGDFRGYRRNGGLFTGFPEQVVWRRAVLTADDVMQIRYIDYSYWNELSRGTRLPSVAAQTVRAGSIIYGQSNDGFWEIAQAVCRGATFMPLILTAVSPAAPLVVMEGHARLTSYALARECLPANMEMIVGFSPEFSHWDAHGVP